MAKDTLQISQFNDYTIFLNQYVCLKKLNNPRWTLGIFARSLGLKSTSSITKILNGQRNLGPALTEKVITHLNLNTRDAECFRRLVKFKKVNLHLETPGHSNELSSINYHKSIKRFLDLSEFQLISNWYCYPIKEAINLKSFQDDIIKIKNLFRFKLNSSQIKEAIELLINLKLVKRTPNGRLESSCKNYETTSDVKSDAIRSYHTSMLKLAISALRSIPVDEREFNSTTFTFDQYKINEAKIWIRNMREEFESKFGNVDGDQVVQFQCQFFPLTK